MNNIPEQPKNRPKYFYGDYIRMLNTRIGENYNANDVINSNDLRKRILNIDSTFRSDISDPSSAFTYKLEHPYKNLIRLRLASIEILTCIMHLLKIIIVLLLKHLI